MGHSFNTRLKKMGTWSPPHGWQKFTTIDAHTAGEPLRVILTGLPELLGKTILERRQYMKDQFDTFRTALMWEPRGHADMYGCIITAPVTEDADFGVLFLHNEGYSTMCGHGIIAVTKIAVETGLVEKRTPEICVKIDTPAGLVTAYAVMRENEVERIYFHNVPSFVLAFDEEVDVPGLGKIKYDIAFGGAFYAFVDVKSVGLTCFESDFRPLIEKGMHIKRAIMQQREIVHPFEKDLNFLYGTIFIGDAENPRSHSRNVCIFAEGEVDRSPTGTGVSARAALHYFRDEIALNQEIEIESIIGSSFRVSAREETMFGDHKAVIPQVTGDAFITGKHEFLLDPKDSMRNGFILR
ncbi:proline racemase family protein [candidate division KSB1 bacterium]|nr:proline racemase family protein [candidate division KSB1 bacterium]